ncbi:MAG: DUF1697 domain-containing protein [Cardiobacteriaceae bacterium]|nr:DUF1697 domain-containing protein [Cardiobacteriaceae bacterium]
MTLHRHAVFLRGVMPSGKNAVKMAALREALGKHGLADVSTWIQSGNIALSSADDAATLAQRVHDILQRDLGVDIVKNADELAAILAEQPFADAAPARIFYTLYNTAPDAALLASALAEDFGDNRLAAGEHALYMHIPGDASRSKLSNNALEKRLRITLTTRNRNTLAKMLELVS